MKRETAIKNVNTIAARLKNISGLIGTPNTDHECFKVRAAYVFGSTVKGSINPNDLVSSDSAIESDDYDIKQTKIMIYPRNDFLMSQ